MPNLFLSFSNHGKVTATAEIAIVLRLPELLDKQLQASKSVISPCFVWT
jgi:hypothetical protein